MPYVAQEMRAALDPVLKPVLAAVRVAGDGVLNYVVTRIVLAYLGDAPNYTAYNAAIGVLESAKLELYRRRVAPYEDAKITENGDV